VDKAEIVYLGHDNTIDFILKASSIAQSLGSVTQMTITIGSTLVANSSAASGAITWSGAGYDTGEIRIKLGDQSVSAGDYNAPLVVYDAANTDGIVWGYIPVVIKADPEAAP
jgi:hypothetical protein